jgi:spore germination protein KC
MGKIFIFCPVLISLILLSGCWDMREIEERIAVVAIGVDKGEEDNELRVSVQIPVPINIAGGKGGGGGGAEPVQVVSANGRTFLDAFRKLQMKVNQELFYGHTRIIVFSEEVAREGINDVIDSLRREPQVRRLLWPVIIREKDAVELLNFKPKLEQVPTVFLMSMIQGQSKAERLSGTTLGDVYIDLSNSTKQPRMIAVDLENEEEVELSGLAVFRGDQLVGFLDKIETMDWLRLTQKRDGGKFSIDIDENNYVSMRPEDLVTDYEFLYKDGKVLVNITCDFNGSLIEATMPLDLDKRENMRRIEQKIEKELEKRSMKMIRKVQTEFESDVLNFGEKLKAYHYDIWEKINWETEFPDAKISVKYEVDIVRTGMTSK